MLTPSPRAGAGGGAPAPVPPVALVPAITQGVALVTGADGQIKHVPTLFTQLFSSVPTQAPAPQVGSIGMGTLTGEVGAVRTEQAKSDSRRQMEKVEWVWSAMILLAMGVV